MNKKTSQTGQGDTDIAKHERSKYTKDDLKRKFVLHLKRNGKPSIKEVKWSVAFQVKYIIPKNKIMALDTLA